jgi:hypothetical protein
MQIGLQRDILALHRSSGESGQPAGRIQESKQPPSLAISSSYHFQHFNNLIVIQNVDQGLCETTMRHDTLGNECDTMKIPVNVSEEELDILGAPKALRDLVADRAAAGKSTLVSSVFGLTPLQVKLTLKCQLISCC